VVVRFFLDSQDEFGEKGYICMSTERPGPGQTGMFQERLLEELRIYAGGRQSDVTRGAETPELAALLLEKFGLGMAAAAKALEFNFGDLTREMDRLCVEIDPEFNASRQKRWAARPAGLIFKAAADS
jgi:hypothetical protein